MTADATRWRTAWRQHELASDRRAGAWARNRARRAQLNFVRRNWPRMALLPALIVPFGAGMASFLPAATGGFLVGVLVTAVGSALWFITVQATGTAPTMAGDDAEQWTARELRRLRRQGWLLVNRLVLLNNEDIDHVLLGPGGCYAVETKWTATPWLLNPPDDRVVQAATQASRSAKRLRLWQPLRSIGFPVHPVVFLWGAGLSDLPEDQQVVQVHDVTVVAGPHSQAWRQRLPSDRLTPDEVRGGWQVLDQRARTRDDVAPLSIPPSLFGMYLYVLLAASCFTAGLFATSLLFQWDSLWLGLLGVALLATGAALARRWHRLRLAATAFLAGVLCAGLLVVTAVVANIVGL